ncbi:hypothetical protein, partial [Rhizobium sp. Root482]|uniref:hypothetical protein n=1 Tax=Rhizobium sp. Root482 TaxID=1736543 RepID=UPI0006F78B11
MTVQFIAVTSSDDVARYVGLKRTEIFPKDLRKSHPGIFSQFEVYAIKAKTAAEALSAVYAHASNDFDNVKGVFMLIDERFGEMVIPPFLTGLRSRIHAAIFSFCAGVMPPMPILGR